MARKLRVEYPGAIDHVLNRGDRQGCGWIGCWASGASKDSPAGRQRLEQALEERRGAREKEEEFKRIRRGWCLGGETFREELLTQMSGRRRR